MTVNRDNDTPVQPQTQAMGTVLRKPQDSEITSGIV